MITAHLPSGYVLGRYWPRSQGVLAAAVVGGVLPDFDLIWFYFVDDRAFHHHRYWVHAPMFWALIALVCLPLCRKIIPQYFEACLVFFTALMVHLLLDSISGEIMWLWPWSTALYALIEVPARFDWWVLNFILHPVFILEICIWIWAIFLLFRRPL